MASMLTLVDVFIPYRLLPYSVSCLQPIAAELVEVLAGLGTYRLLSVELDLIW
ncbi:hypothetical protein ACFLT5_00240 [Chloroflexota bacterium]